MSAPQRRVGLTIPFADVPLTELPLLAQRAETAGYNDLWSAEAVGYDGFAPLAAAAVATRHIRLATGIVNPYTRGRMVLAQTCATLQDLSGGRFVLGLGASSNVIVEQWNGIPFERPLRKMRETVEYLRTVLAGERGDGGFKLPSPPVAPIPIVLAALRDRMLLLAREEADGAFTNFLPLSGVAQVVEAFGAPEKELACRFFCFLGGDEEEALARAKRFWVAYSTVPVYTEFFRWLGWGEQVDRVVQAWQEGDRKKALELAPEELVREIFFFGPVEAQRERLDEFAAAGITTAILSISCPPEELGPAIDALAPS